MYHDIETYDPSDYETCYCINCEHFYVATEGKEMRGCCYLRMMDYLKSSGMLKGKTPEQIVDSALDYICMNESDGSEDICDDFRER
jgi:hypothetical protein